MRVDRYKGAVTSLVEVWIEIKAVATNKDAKKKSLPLWKCGLKFHWGWAPAGNKAVTSLVEVWIEIPAGPGCWSGRQVTSLVEVWIEIGNTLRTKSMILVTSLVEVWIEIASRAVCSIDSGVTSLVEVWIEMVAGGKRPSVFFGHFPCGSVDWNCDILKRKGDQEQVTSLVEVWIEIWWIFNFRRRRCHFPCGSVDWNCAGIRGLTSSASHFPCGSVDWNTYNGYKVYHAGESLPLWKCGLILSILVYTFFSRMFDLMLPPVAKHSIVVA